MDADQTLAFDGDVAQAHYPKQTRAVLSKRKDRFADLDSYCNLLGLALTDSELSDPKHSPTVMPDALDNPESQWFVEPKLETVDGAECHVLHSRSTGQRIWIDPAVGLGMRFRETRQAVESMSPDQWPLAMNAEFSDFAEVGPKTWLPRRVRSVGYVGTRSPRDQWNKVRTSTNLAVNSIRVGALVKDELFRLSFPKGTLVFDGVRDRTFRIGDAN